MKLSITQATTLCTIVGVLATTFSPQSASSQKPISGPSTMSELDSNLSIPGNNNATYGPIPRSKQLFNIEFLEIAPTPWEVDKYFFTLLRGYIPDSKADDAENLDKLLATATVKISLGVTLPSGEVVPPKVYTVPLRTTAFAPFAHVSIRDATGKYRDHLTAGSMNDILTDYVAPSMFVQKGTWKLGVLAELEDGRCLFAIELTQWLEGRR